MNVLKKTKLRKFLPSIFIFAVVLLLPFGDVAEAGGFAVFWSWISSTLGGALGAVFGAFNVVLGQLMIWVAKGFQTAIEWTIIDYSSYFGAVDGIQGGVNTVWTNFRDMANIAIIGIFVYMSFMVMLNVQNFDAGKFAVRVLVVALLINFSLFFTKVIIDISNITAIQFYQVLTDNGTTEFGEEILERTGIISVSDSRGLVGNAAGNVGSVAKLGWDKGLAVVISYGLFSSMFLVAITSVFLYATILLFVRALTFVFLMMVSPLAFAAYMIPQMEKFWNQWWSLLIKNALFAPLLMMLLYATLEITSQLQGQGSSLASLMSGELGSVGAIFNLAIVLGMFYTSVKIASMLSLTGTDLAESFARKTFGFGAKWSGAGVAGRGVAGGVLGGASWLARNTAGRAASGLQKTNKRLPSWMSSQKLDTALERMKQSDMRLGSSKMASELAAKAGITLKTVSIKDDEDFRRKRMEQSREDQAETEKKEAKDVLDKDPASLSNEERDKYGEMQKQQLKMYQNALEKDVTTAEKKRKDSADSIRNIDRTLAGGGLTQDEIDLLDGQKESAKLTLLEESEKIKKVKRAITMAGNAMGTASRGSDISTTLSGLSITAGRLGDDSIAKREIEAIHKMQPKIREQLMERQYFDREKYQISEEADRGDRLWDQRAKEAHEQARKTAKMPEHYNRMAGRMKGDEAASDEEIAERALKGL